MIEPENILWDDEINPDDVEWESPSPDFTVSRLGKQVSRGWQQGLASLEQSQAGGTRDMIREIGKEKSIPREIVSERDPKFKIKRPPLPTIPHADLASRYGQAVTSPEMAHNTYQQELRKEAAQYEKSAMERPDILPGTPEGFGGLVEQAVTSFAQFGPSMLITAANLPVGTATAFKQLHGMKYAELKERGVPDERANDIALLTAAINTPLEQAGTVFQLKAARALLLGKEGSGWLRRFVGALVQSSGANALEEFLQQPADDIATLVAEHKKLTPEELGEIAGRSVEAAKVGAVAGAILPLAGQAGRTVIPRTEAHQEAVQEIVQEEVAEQPIGLDPGEAEAFKQALRDGNISMEQAESMSDQASPEIQPQIDKIIDDAYWEQQEAEIKRQQDSQRVKEQRKPDSVFPFPPSQDVQAKIDKIDPNEVRWDDEFDLKESGRWEEPRFAPRDKSELPQMMPQPKSAEESARILQPSVFETPTKSAEESARIFKDKKAVDHPLKPDTKDHFPEQVGTSTQDRRKSDRRQPPQPDMGGASEELQIKSPPLSPIDLTQVPDRRILGERRRNEWQAHLKPGAAVKHGRGKYTIEEIEGDRALISNDRGERIVNVNRLKPWSERKDTTLIAKKKKAIGTAWVKNQWRPIIAKHEIGRGKNKGKYRITLPDGKKRLVDADAVRVDEASKVDRETSRMTKTLKNELGSSELVNDILTKGAEIYQAGVKSYGHFKNQMRRAFKNVWDKIKNHMRQLWNLLKDHRGSIEIGRKGESDLLKQYFGKTLSQARERRKKSRKVSPKTGNVTERVGSVNLARQDVSEMAKDIQAAVVKEKKSMSWEDTEALSGRKIKNSRNLKAAYNRMKRMAGGQLSSDIDAMREVNVVIATKMEQTLSDFKDGKISEKEAHKKLQAFEDFLTVTADASSEIGRALNIHKKMVSPDRVYKAYKVIKGKANKRQLGLIHDATRKLLDGTLTSNEMKRIEEEIPNPTISEYLMEYWYNCILSGPPTHMVNIISNTAWTTFQIPHKMFLSGIDRVYSTLTGSERTRYLNETIPMFAGYKRGFKKGRRAAGSMFKTGAVTEFEDKWTQEVGYFKSAFERSPNKVLRKIAPFITVPTKALRAMDVWANSIAYEGALGSMARRQANKEGAKDLKKRTDEILKEWSEKIPNEVHEEALKEARYATFTDTPDKLTGYIISSRNVKGLGPIIRTIIPFVNTISNLTKRGVEMTPIIGLGKEFVSRRMGRGQTNPEVIAKQIEGAILALIILSIAGSGRITGPMPEKKNERDYWYRIKKKPWSIKIGDTWYEYRRMEPFNTVIAMAASFYDKILKGTDEKNLTEKFADFASQVKFNLLDGSYFSGLQTVLNRHGQRRTAIPRYVSSWVPYSSFFRSINRATEVVLEGSAKPREGVAMGPLPKEWVRSFSQVIPGLSGKMPAKLDLWGGDAVIPGGILRQWLPYRWSKEQKDPVETALEQAGYYPGLPRDYITIHGERIDLDEKIYREYAINFGAELKKRFKRTIKKPAWKNWDKKKRFAELKKERITAGRKTRKQLIAQLRKRKLLAQK